MHLGADPAGEAVQRGVALGRGVPLLELNGLEQDSAVDRAAAVFGYKRRTPATTPALEAALTWALHRGRLTEQPNGLLTV
jgi:hypothetical protein